MKRFLAILLSCALVLTGCGTNDSKSTNLVSIDIETSEDVKVNTDTEEVSKALEFVEIEDEEIKFDDLSDPKLLQYVEDNIYADLISQFNSDDYIVEDISTLYISNEYLEELEYNSKKNIYFGYTLEQIDAQFEDTRYVFTLGDNGNTVVQPFEKYDDTYDQIIKNVAIGTGVILVCVTVSVVSGGLGASTISVVFAASAKTGTTFALSSALISGVSSGVVTQFQTGDFEETIKTASLNASEDFKWGAITGAIIGGASQGLAIYKEARTIPTSKESEKRALEKYGGLEQVSYLNGEQVLMSTNGATRPDIVRFIDGHLEAIEVKNYSLENKANRNTLYNEILRQVTARTKDLPKGSTQRIVLDVKGRGYSNELIQTVINNIKVKCANIYFDIPVDVMY